MAAIDVPHNAKGSIIKNQLRIKFIKSADKLFIVALRLILKRKKNDLAF
tara:strand:- start:21 stop:167 length:147 start_codon:yes stop_codon:yes gene_type:complete